MYIVYIYVFNSVNSNAQNWIFVSTLAAILTSFCCGISQFSTRRRFSTFVWDLVQTCNEMLLLKYDMVMVNTWQNMISILNMYREYAVHLLLSQSLCCVVLCCVAFYVNFTKKHTNTHVCCIQQKIIIRNIPTVFSVLVSSLDVTANVLNNLNRFNCKYEFE